MTPSTTNISKRLALFTTFLATAFIAAGYASAFSIGGPPVWAPWLLALGIPLSIGGIIVVGAARGKAGIGSLAIPIAFVILTLALGFGLALGLPATESGESTLWLGLPARAAIVIYGLGLMPAIILPLAYALTFSSQTLTAEDVERVRVLGAQRAAALSEKIIPRSAAAGGDA